MLHVISPSKTLNFEALDYGEIARKVTKPRSLEESSVLIQDLKELSSIEVQKLMKVSEKIANLNVERYRSFETPFTPANSKPAGFAFKGDVYRGLDFESLTDEQVQFAQTHLRVLSGLYGVLRPMDLIQPYRLEMGTKFRNDLGKNLYEFWGEKITNKLNKDLKESGSDYLINLASQEYFKAIKRNKLNKPVLDIQFKELRDDKYKIIAFSAKYARGLMSRFIIENGVANEQALKDFNVDGYSWNSKLSGEQEWIFTRTRPAKKN